MALVVTLEQQAGSQICTVIAVKDSTGVGATGYAAPNHVAADVARLIVEVIIPHSSVYTEPFEISTADAQGIMAGTANLEITSIVLDQTQTTLSALPDGAYFLRYTPYWTAVATLSLTNGSTAATASTTLAVAPYAGVNRIKIGDEYYGVVVSGTSVTLDRAYTGTTASGVAFDAGFTATIYLKQTCNGDNCVAAQYAAVFNQSNNCSELEKNAVRDQKENLYAANVMWGFQEYVQFQLLIDLVTTYCNGLSEGCGCA